MKIFLTGASGYIGGSVANKLLQQGHQVYGLVRSPEKAQLVKQLGISPVLGSLDDGDRLEEFARSADAVINAASSDHRPAVEALVKALAESGKTLIHTSGSSIVGDDVRGESESPNVYADDRLFCSHADSASAGCHRSVCPHCWCKSRYACDGNLSDDSLRKWTRIAGG